jgi:ATP-dependent helicase Lhr and Lhr-like helicase
VAARRSLPAHPDPLAGFGPATADWFRAAFERPTAAQALGWPAISAGAHTLISAPTGSGKTLAAFLWCLDRLMTGPGPSDRRGVRVLYVSPLKALVHDVERNLRAPLAGIALAAQRLETGTRPVRVAMRTGDTPAAERRALLAHPPEILVTTPESLYLILTSAAREALRGVEWLIVDEIHALAGTKRGAHLALSLERLEALTGGSPQRIGLSATARPLEVVASFLGGRADGGPPDGTRAGPPRHVTVVDAGVRKPLELKIVVPVDDMSHPGAGMGDGDEARDPEERSSIWPAVYPRILELVRSHRSTIIFVNSRRLAERLAQRLNELAGEELTRAHHGSIAREQRLEIEDALKSGRLPGLVATSSLELGIDMGAVDLVIQVESPRSVASGLQRIGRAGHQVGEPSRGVIFPKYRGDLLEAAVVAQRMHAGAIESTVVPRNPLDVLAQQVVAIASDRPWPVDELYALVRRAEGYADLGRDAFEATLGMLAGAYPSDEFAELRPRVVWDRVAGTVASRRDARTVALTSGGTIPDRGLFGVYLDPGDDAATGPGGARAAARRGGRRVGELDEEMVYEARPGEVILLGASAWRIEEIAHDRVLVSPAPGQPGRVPFWKGDRAGRPLELGRALGAFTRGLAAAVGGGRGARDAALDRLRTDNDLDVSAAGNLIGYLSEELEATGALPTDRTIVLERFRDELGDWRICLLSPFGARVHAPWALAIEARLRERFGLEVQPLWSDDGVVVRLPATDEPGWEVPQDAASDDGPAGRAKDGEEPRDGEGPGVGDVLRPWDLVGRPGEEAAAQAVRIGPDEVEELVVGALGGSALFASRFRENAARALLLPKARPGRRRPLWQMRQRSAQLLAVASRFGSFPIILETYRECLQDVFDLSGLREVLSGLEQGRIRLHNVEVPRASPFASSLLFDYVATYMYEGDAPLADRRAQALALDRDLLRELLGADELRELLDPDALAGLELELQALTPDRAAGSADALHDLLRRLGDLREDEVVARVRGGRAAIRRKAAREWLEALAGDGRAVEIRLAGEARWIAAADAGRYRDGLGAGLPLGLPAAYLDAGDEPLAGLLMRHARRHGPFLAEEPARRWGLPVGPVEAALGQLVKDGRLLHGEFLPNGSRREWCDPDVLRALRRRSLARLRHEIEPVEPAALARFLLDWQGVRSSPASSPTPGEDGSQAWVGAALSVTSASGRSHVRGRDRFSASPQRLVEVVAQLEGLALPASVLERDVLPARIPGYSPRLLDELGAAGEVCWVGRGRLGRDDGRVALYRPDRLALGLEPPSLEGARDEDRGWLADALEAHLQKRGASFYRDLLAAGLEAARAEGRSLPGQQETLDAIWTLVWAGIATNDTFAPLRAIRWGRSPRRPSGPRLAGLSRMGPPEAAGRWSLVADTVASAMALAGGGPPSSTHRRHALVQRLLDRQGVVTRDSVAAEEVQGGFGAVYPVLRELEEHGRVRRGYFVEGLGGAQFASAAAVDRLRASRAGPAEIDAPSDGSGPWAARAAVALLAATDPANPYGATVPWPRRDDDDRRPLPRAAGAYVALVAGVPVLYLERGGRSLQTLPASDDPDLASAALGALRSLVADRRLRSLEIERIDGQSPVDAAWQERLAGAGFRPGYRGWALSVRPAAAR